MKVWNIRDHRVGWGHNLYWFSWERRTLAGYLPRPHPNIGDEVRSEMASGRTARFKIKAVRSMTDPRDQVFIDLEDVGYVE